MAPDLLWILLVNISMFDDCRYHGSRKSTLYLYTIRRRRKRGSFGGAIICRRRACAGGCQSCVSVVTSYFWSISLSWKCCHILSGQLTVSWGFSETSPLQRSTTPGHTNSRQFSCGKHACALFTSAKLWGASAPKSPPLPPPMNTILVSSFHSRR